MLPSETGQGYASLPCTFRRLCTLQLLRSNQYIFPFTQHTVFSRLEERRSLHQKVERFLEPRASQGKGLVTAEDQWSGRRECIAHRKELQVHYSLSNNLLMPAAPTIGRQVHARMESMSRLVSSQAKPFSYEPRRFLLMTPPVARLSHPQAVEGVTGRGFFLFWYTPVTRTGHCLQPDHG